MDCSVPSGGTRPRAEREGSLPGKEAADRVTADTAGDHLDAPGPIRISFPYCQDKFAVAYGIKRNQGTLSVVGHDRDI